MLLWIWHIKTSAYFKNKSWELVWRIYFEIILDYNLSYVLLHAEFIIFLFKDWQTDRRSYRNEFEKLGWLHSQAELSEKGKNAVHMYSYMLYL